VGLDRQINKYARFSLTYMNNRGVHVQRSRNINAAIDGLYPSGDSTVRLLTESTGFSRSDQLIISPSVNYKKMFLFASNMLATAKPTPRVNRRILTIFMPSGDRRHSLMSGSGS